MSKSFASIDLTIKETLEIIQCLSDKSPSRELLQKKVKEYHSREKRDGVENVLSSMKIRKIEFAQDKSRSTLDILRESWFGNTYRKHLRKYYFFRQSSQWLWRTGYPVYVNYIAMHLFNREDKRWRKLIKLNEFVKKNNLLSCQLANEVTIEVEKSKVFPVSEQYLLMPSRSKYSFPEISVAMIGKSKVYGGTNLVLLEDEVICHDLYDFHRDFTSDELHNRTRINAKASRIRWLMFDEKIEAIARAAIFTDACAANYAHWMTEVMPRIVLFCANKKFEDIPIIINEGLHQNIMESLSLVVGDNREIIILSTGRALNVEVLYLTSVVGYVPFGARNHKLLNHSHGMFSPIALKVMAHQFNELVDNEEDESYPEKIFLRRNSGVRQITNLTELEELLVAMGYVIVETDEMTFLQQVNLFKNAKEVVAPTGAAVVNAIFCTPNAHVIVLMGKHEDMIYRYWCNMLSPLQIRVSYVLGNIVKNNDLGIHGDYFIDPKNVVELLDA